MGNSGEKGSKGIPPQSDYEAGIYVSRRHPNAKIFSPEESENRARGREEEETRRQVKHKRGRLIKWAITVVLFGMAGIVHWILFTPVGHVIDVATARVEVSRITSGHRVAIVIREHQWIEEPRLGEGVYRTKLGYTPSSPDGAALVQEWVLMQNPTRKGKLIAAKRRYDDYWSVGYWGSAILSFTLWLFWSSRSIGGRTFR